MGRKVYREIREKVGQIHEGEFYGEMHLLIGQMEQIRTDAMAKHDYRNFSCDVDHKEDPYSGCCCGNRRELILEIWATRYETDAERDARLAKARKERAAKRAADAKVNKHRPAARKFMKDKAKAARYEEFLKLQAEFGE